MTFSSLLTSSLKQTLTISTAAVMLVLIPTLNSAQAAEEIKICGQYQRADKSWSKLYKLTGTLSTGAELNQKHNSSSYNPDNHFIVVKWKKGGASTFEFAPAQDPTFSEQDYHDQRGRRWQIKKGWSSCY